MFQHVLLPTDGSELALHGVRNGVRFAKAIGARVTVLTVTPGFRPEALSAHAILRAAREDEVRSRSVAHKALNAVARLAHAAGVDCALLHQVSDKPGEVIARVADDLGCDLIVMASHGYTGLRALTLGSVTGEVVARARVPVFVWR